jgi:hypothetical protein
MTKQPRKIRYSSPNCIQDIFGFICNYDLSYSKPGQKYIAKDYIDHLLIDESQEIRFPIIDHVHTHALAESPVRHRPRALSPAIVEIPVSYNPHGLPPIPMKIPD